MVEKKIAGYSKFIGEKIRMSKFDTTYIDIKNSYCDGDAQYNYQTNLAKITSILQNNSGADIFCAWGHSSNIFEAIYKKAINDVISILQTNNVSTYKYYNQNGLHAATLPTQPFYPPHGSKW